MKKTKKKKPEEAIDPQDKDAAEPTEETVAEETPAPVEEVVDEALETKFLRLQADFDNFRKRTNKERSDWFRQASESLMEELLPVLDHFEMGLNNAQQHHADKAVVDGFTLVHDQLHAVLKKFGLDPVDAEGEVFDPHLHEAITHLPSEEYPADTVVAQTRRGYKLGNKLIRAAQVVVSSGAGEDVPAQEDSAPAEEED